MFPVIRTLAALVLLAAAVPASAHGPAAHDAAWTPDPGTLSALSTGAGLYALGAWRLDRRARSRLLGGLRPVAFAAGLALLGAALASPLDVLAAHLFSAHMAQHLLLMLAAPPLLAYGRPLVAMAWALPLAARRGIGRCRQLGPVLGPLLRGLARPLPVGLLASFALWFWHLPGPHGAALGSPPWHWLEHLSFFLTALAFWTLVVEPVGRRRIGYGGALVIVAALGMQESLLGALLTFAGRPLYPVYGDPAAFHLTPLEDQELAGLFMWVPAALVHLGFMSVLFLAWFENAGAPERVAPRAARPLGRHGLWLASCLALFLGGCSGHGDIPPSPKVAGGDPQRAPALIRHYGCGSCHRIPGVSGAVGGVGPPLDRFAGRAYVAGVLTNNPADLMRWLRFPQSVAPGNAMPDMDVTEQDARDIAAYLYTLR